MSKSVVIRTGLTIPPAELTWKFSRSSGPGGQSVNTSDSRASLSFDVANSAAFTEYQRERALERLCGRLVDGVLTIHAEAARSQYQNRLAAQERLASILRRAIAPRPPKRRPTKPSMGAQQRRITQKKKRGETKRLRRNLDD